jgi:hypothetical protein
MHLRTPPRLDENSAPTTQPTPSSREIAKMIPNPLARRKKEKKIKYG